MSKTPAVKGKPAIPALPSRAETASALPRPILGTKWDGRDSFTVEEAGCEILGLSRCSAYTAVKNGELPVLWIGRRAIVPRHVLERLLASVA